MKVLKDFTCKKTGKRYHEGESYNGDRGPELLAKGLLSAEKVEVKEPVKQEVKVEPKAEVKLSTEKVKKQPAKEKKEK